MDPLMISTAALGVSTVVLAVGYVGRGDRISKLLDKMATMQTTIEFQRAHLREYREAEEARKAHLRSISKAGAAASAAKKAADKPQTDAAAAAARAKTIAELATTPMRSRAKVVAPVKAKRTKAKNNSGAGVAARLG